MVDENNGFLEDGADFGMGIVDEAFLLDGRDDFVNVPNLVNSAETLDIMTKPIDYGGERRIE